jgi:hypothetical protein
MVINKNQESCVSSNSYFNRFRLIGILLTLPGLRPAAVATPDGIGTVPHTPKLRSLQETLPKEYLIRGGSGGGGPPPVLALLPVQREIHVFA